MWEMAALGRLCLLLITLARTSAATGDWSPTEGPDWTGWRRLGRCRAHCVHQFVPWPPSDTRIELSKPCTECWGLCDFMFDTETGRRVCDSSNDAQFRNRGSAAFCDFVSSFSDEEDTVPYTYTTAPTVNVLDRSHLIVTWDIPRPHTEMSPPLHQTSVVYSLFWADSNNTVWNYLHMLTDRRTDVEEDLTTHKDLQFRVVAHSSGFVLSDDVVYVNLAGLHLMPDSGHSTLHATHGPSEQYYTPDVEHHMGGDDETVPDVEESPHASRNQGRPSISLEVNVTRKADGRLVALIRWRGSPNGVVQVFWGRDTCNVNKVYRRCDEVSDQWRRTQTPVSINSQVVGMELDDLTYNSRYWVEMKQDNVTSERTPLITPPCESPDASFKVCQEFRPASFSVDTLLVYHSNISCMHYGTAEALVRLQWTPVISPGGGVISYKVETRSVNDHLETPPTTTSPYVNLTMFMNDYYVIKIGATITPPHPGGTDRIFYPEVFYNTSEDALYSEGCVKLLTVDSVQRPTLHVVIIVVTLGCAIVILTITAVIYKKCHHFRDIIITKATVAKSNSYKSSAGGYPHCLKEETLPMLPDEWELDPGEVTLGRELGEGAFGRVMTGYYRDSKVAIKILKDDVEDYFRDDLRREVNLMKKIGKHPNIVSMIGACTLREPLALVMEYMPYGNLQNFLRRCRLEGELKRTDDSRCELIYSQLNELGNLEEWSVSSTDVLAFARQVVLAMEYLSDKQYIHRDLAARNILLGPNKVVKVCDFGLARIVYNGDLYYKLTTGRLPMKWMAIESLRDRKFTTSSDVWSFGILLWEIVNMGASPYPGVALADLCRLLASGYRMEQPVNCSPELYDIMCRCWFETSSDRPTFSELRQQLEHLLARNRDYLDLSTLDLPTNRTDPEETATSDASSPKMLGDGTDVRDPPDGASREVRWSDDVANANNLANKTSEQVNGNSTCTTMHRTSLHDKSTLPVCDFIAEVVNKYDSRPVAL